MSLVYVVCGKAVALRRRSCDLVRQPVLFAWRYRFHPGSSWPLLPMWSSSRKP